MSRRLATLAATVAGSLALTAVTAAGPAVADTSSRAPGNKPLVKVLGADGVAFDSTWGDFDIVEAAVLAVLAEKPDSPLGLITQGKQRLTVFLPTDRAFQRLVTDLVGKTPKREKAVFKRVAALTGDIDTLEAVLLYHVVVGKTLTSPKVLAAAEQSAAVPTAQGGTIGVRQDRLTVRLADADRDDLDPRAVLPLLDINRGNKQVAHGINRVLRPLDL
ncbi:fasciclin domain-containing protein [Nocardioides sp.]|uniref:fasciclin domain-containing protein n=1 Tax=Nocardioides sp. TaxID=35761 RepID=UPI0027165A01|nr:fasciclin domain-containing protein [Nocardioides sp.]MDO9457243.1 fasciclin domain-containing protein [Nocardioides sp.]